MEWKAYRVAAPSGNGAMTLICYNLNVSPRHQQVQAIIKKKIILFGTVLKKCLPPPKNACCFIIGNHKGRRTIRQQYIRTHRIYRQTVSSLPHTEGWAVIGVQEKYLSPSTVQTISLTENRLELNVLCTGTLKVWIENSSKQELRSISIDTPQKL